MSGRPYLILVGTVLLLGACSDTLTVAPYQVAPEAREGCVRLAAEAPETVAGQPRREVSDDRALAWGDPAIVVRCGVAEPEDLEPTSRCDMVGRVGWFTQSAPAGTVFSTIGRAFTVSVTVPEDYEPAADALIDLEDAIVQNVPEERPCV